MGTYLNPGNSGFSGRRFGKSFAAQLLIELKWNKSARGAIDQIKDKKYSDALKDYGGEILLVGINYDKDAPAGERKHTCVIEKMELD